MPASDDENDDGESEPYTITSKRGIEYQSTETLEDQLKQCLVLAGDSGKIAKTDLAMLRELLADTCDLVARNTAEGEVGIEADDTLDVLELPDGWETDLDDDDEDDGE